MNKKNLIFTALFLTLNIMPFSVFAGLPEDVYLEEWMTNKFCAADSKLNGMNCSENLVFSCQKYAEDFTQKRSLFININKYLKKACQEDQTTLFSNIRHIMAAGYEVRAVICKTGYTHPTTGSEILLRCVKDPNFSKQDYDKCIEKGCSYTNSSKTSISLGSITKSSSKYECVCSDAPESSEAAIAEEITNMPETGSVGPAYYTGNELSAVDKQALQDEINFQNSGMVAEDERSERAKANTEYAENLRKKDNWVKAEEQIDELPAEATVGAVAIAPGNEIPQEAITNSAPVEYVPKGQEDERTKANTEYAEQLRKKDNWVKAEEQIDELPAEATVGAVAVAPEEEKQSSSEDIETAKIANKINNDARNVKIGDSITATRDSEEITKAKERWADSCTNIKNDTVKEAEIDYSLDGTKLTCVIAECKQEGYEPAADGKSCKQTEAAKQAEKDKKAAEKQAAKDQKAANKVADEKQKVIEKINKSASNLKIGDSISYPKTFKSDVIDAMSSWKKACEYEISKEPGATGPKDADYNKEAGDNIVVKCLITACDGDKKPINNGLACGTGKECKDIVGGGIGQLDDSNKCKLTDCEDKNYTLNKEKNKCELKVTADNRNKKETKAEDKAFQSDIDKFTAAFDAFVTKYTNDCKNKVDHELKDGECKPKTNGHS